MAEATEMTNWGVDLIDVHEVLAPRADEVLLDLGNDELRPLDQDRRHPDPGPVAAIAALVRRRDRNEEDFGIASQAGRELVAAPQTDR